MHWITEVLLVVVIALVVAALIRAFVAQVFYIPSGSMEDTLHKDDWIVVSKLTTTQAHAISQDTAATTSRHVEAQSDRSNN